MAQAEAVVRRPPRRSASEGASSRSVAGVGGASSGTLLLTFAQQAGVNTLLGEVLLYSAPTVAVISGALMLVFKNQVSLWTERWTVRQAIKTLTKQLNDPNVSDAQKAKTRSFLDEVHQAVAEAELARVKAVRITL